MAASDEMMKLASRAKVAEDHVKAAQSQARSDIEAQVTRARTNAEKKAQSLQAQSATADAEVSAWWSDVQRDWSDHITQVRADVKGRKAERDKKRLVHRAETAERNAAAAVDFASAAIEEAEYAVLDAALARLDAEQAQSST